MCVRVSPDLNKECTECCPVLRQAQNFTLQNSWNQVSALFSPRFLVKPHVFILLSLPVCPRWSLSKCWARLYGSTTLLFRAGAGRTLVLDGKMELGTGTECPPSWPATLVPGFLGSGGVTTSQLAVQTVLLPSEEDLGHKPALRFIWTWEEKSPPVFVFCFNHHFQEQCYDCWRLILLVEVHLHISVCVCLATCVDT